MAEFVERVALPRLDLHGAVEDLLNALMPGYSLMEINWEASSGQALPTGLAWVHTKLINFNNSIQPMLETEAHPSGAPLTPFKFIWHQYRARTGWANRAGLGRGLAWMWLFKNYAVRDWAAFCEIYGQPLRVGKYPVGASASDQDALLDAVTNIGSDAAAIIPESTIIDFVEAQKYGSIEVYERFIKTCQHDITLAVLGQVLTSEASGDGGSGSRALGEVHADVRQDLTQADARSLDATINRDLIRPLILFNFGADALALAPKFHLLAEPPEDLVTEAELDRKLIVEIGLDISQEYLAAKYNRPLRAEGETPVIRAANAPAPPMFARLRPAGAVAAGRAEVAPTDDQTALDQAAVARLAADALGAELIRALAPLAEAVDETETVDQARDRITSWSLTEEQRAALAGRLADLTGLARLAGRASVQGGTDADDE